MHGHTNVQKEAHSLITSPDLPSWHRKHFPWKSRVFWDINTESTGENVQTFRRITVSPSSRYSSLGLFLECLTLKMKALWFFETPVTAYQ